jgi:hypothetical protein
VSALDAAGVVAFLAARPELAVRVGPPGSEGSWSVKEVGDGNINFVYIVTVSFWWRQRQQQQLCCRFCAASTSMDWAGEAACVHEVSMALQ